jgi:two-component system, OmpR family, sensor histidine kinase QseC
LLLGVPLLALALWWSVRRGLVPINDIGRALAARNADDFSPVRRESAPAEMQPMLDALDQLLARIAALVQSERRFTADASHELRTPLSAIRAQAQVALAESDPQLRRHALEATLEGCDRAAHLVDQLLALSRLDAKAGSHLEPVDLQAVARGTLSGIASTAIAKGQQLHVTDSQADCAVAGDPALLSVLVRNLADNAVRYAPPGATIIVSVAREGAQTLLVVENSGTMPSAGEVARFGERFFRALGTDESGSGLGLSIAKRIAELHGARFDFTRSPQLGGLRVTVSFPSL